ncbi:MAG: DUF2059 domain-containing protein [Verrucomicrobia bacterium]|nr:DUF2059 domain-containing protein [Verrucomicrobiota bacterium]
MNSPRRCCFYLFGVTCLLLAFTALPAQADDDAASRRSAAEELLKTMRMEEMQARTVEQAKTMIAGMSNRSMQQYNLSPETVAEAKKTQAAMLDLIFRKLSWEAMKSEYIGIYADTFTESELKELTTFYRSPAGQKLLEKQPQLTAKIMEISQKRTMELMPEIQVMTTRRQALPITTPTPAILPTPSGGGK